MGRIVLIRNARQTLIIINGVSEVTRSKCYAVRKLRQNMAKLTWIIFGIFVACSSAHFGRDRNGQNFLQRQISNTFKRTPESPIKPFGVNQVNPEDQKCFTLSRRQFFMSRLVHYPCSRRQPDVPVIRWFMGQIGPVCVSYIREPVYRYFRIPMCCPGYVKDNAGKCSIRTNQMMNNKGRNNEEMMSAASKMRQMMWQRAKQDMERRRAMFFMNMRDNRRNDVRNNRPMMMPRMQLRRPPMSPMFNMYNRQQMPNRPRVAFLRFNRPTPSMPPMPHPVQQPPLSGGMIRIINRKIIPLFPFMRRNKFPMSGRQERPPMVPRVVLSGRINVIPIGLKEFHPTMPSQDREMAPFPSFMNNRGYPQENVQENIESQPPTADFQTDGFHDTHDHHHDHSHGEAHGFNMPMTGESRMTAENVMQVDLPNEPVQMPELVIEQAPSNMNQESCIMQLESAVKTCLKQNNIDVPDVMSAFEPFNDDKSRILCEAEDAIFKCITNAQKDCIEPSDAEVARGMLLETAQTVKTMCDMRQANVASGDSPLPQDLTQQDTSASVENVDAIPTEAVNAAPTPDKEEITIIEDSPAPADPSSAEAVKEAIQHEVHVQEMRMKEYLLPILVGSGVGFMVLVLFLSLVFCCCCKRKFRKKMKMAKELEKPPLKDGIYTIGIAPPTYEVNGIPPMYYEEAKGEKITSRSPAVLEGTAQAEEETEGVKM